MSLGKRKALNNIISSSCLSCITNVYGTITIYLILQNQFPSLGSCQEHLCDSKHCFPEVFLCGLSIY